MVDFIECYPDALTPAQCRQIIQRFESSPHRQPGHVGSGVDRALKDSRDLTISQHADWRDEEQLQNTAMMGALCAYLRKYPQVLIAPLALTTPVSQRWFGGRYVSTSTNTPSPWRNNPFPITPKEFRLLETLMREPGRVFNRVELLEKAFGLDYDGLERPIDVHIRNLRQKIEPNHNQPVYVQTVFGVGYRFGEVSSKQ